MLKRKLWKQTCCRCAFKTFFFHIAFFIKQNSKTYFSGPAWQIKHGHIGPFTLHLVLLQQEYSKPHQKACSPVSHLQTLPIPTPSAPTTEKN